MLISKDKNNIYSEVIHNDILNDFYGYILIKGLIHLSTVPTTIITSI